MSSFVPVPEWFTEFVDKSSADSPENFMLDVKEWEDEGSRKLDEFKGTDFCHSVCSPVRILKYFLYYEDYEKAIGGHPRLIAPVVFSPQAESGRGYCHGGSMCAVVDDAVGWLGFCCTGEVKPWVGFTVQVNTTLKKPIPVGSILKLKVWVDRVEGETGRKVWVKCSLEDATDSNIVYCEGNGLFLKASPK